MPRLVFSRKGSAARGRVRASVRADPSSRPNVRSLSRALRGPVRTLRSPLVDRDQRYSTRPASPRGGFVMLPRSLITLCAAALLLGACETTPQAVSAPPAAAPAAAASYMVF